jgi:hypothetical protein
MPLDAAPRTLNGVGLDSGPVKLTHYLPVAQLAKAFVEVDFGHF